MNDAIFIVTTCIEFFALGAFFTLKVGDYHAPKRSARRFPIRMALLGVIAMCMVIRRCVT